MRRDSTKRSVSAARPTFFIASVLESKRSPLGYVHAGYTLAMHAEQMVDGELDDGAYGEFERHVVADDAEGLYAWLRRYLPRCMALVPHARREAFIRGIAQAMEDSRLA